MKKHLLTLAAIALLTLTAGSPSVFGRADEYVYAAAADHSQSTTIDTGNAPELTEEQKRRVEAFREVRPEPITYYDDHPRESSAGIYAMVEYYLAFCLATAPQDEVMSSSDLRRRNRRGEIARTIEQRPEYVISYSVGQREFDGERYHMITLLETDPAVKTFGQGTMGYICVSENLRQIYEFSFDEDKLLDRIL